VEINAGSKNTPITLWAGVSRCATVAKCLVCKYAVTILHDECREHLINSATLFLKLGAAAPLRALQSSSLLGTAHPVTSQHIPEDLNVSQHLCGKKKIWNSNCRVLAIQLHTVTLTITYFTINNINRENYFSFPATLLNAQ
jgi:hypothetical protein